MTRTSFHQDLEQLQQNLLRMGSLVEEAIFNAVDSLRRQDLSLAEQVLHADDQIDRLESELETECMRLFALQQPLARDLRIIGTVLKALTDLERMGDEAANIAEITLRVGDQPLIKPLIDIPRMAELVRAMVSKALDAFVRRDVDLAFEVRRSDTAVDTIYAALNDELIEMTMKFQSMREANQAFLLLMAARHLERIGDHATNLAERVVYMVTGHVVSHQPPAVFEQAAQESRETRENRDQEDGRDTEPAG
ncbi:MAG TPA: phosphate signaling complex protein PhoU [Firmicutes bacterium]|nr:phosphate signaling complex protein PhoU [Bacillota bacterium]